MLMHARLAFALLLGAVALVAEAADTPSQPPARAADSRAVMTGDQVVQILDETVDWYRTLGAQQQAATQPSDLLILYANRQTADKVVALAFEIARANAELLSSEASAAQASDEAASSQSLSRQQKKLDEQRTAIQAEIEAGRRQLAAAPKQNKSDLQAKISVLQGELDLINARRNLLTNMSQFANESDTDGFGANALKAHIDAIAASIPAASGATTLSASMPAAEALPHRRPAPPAVRRSANSESGTWQLRCSGSPRRRGPSRRSIDARRSFRKCSSRFARLRSSS